ncbi:class I SAM-dependent RNA methyltransferase [Sphingomicrobium clamense]|uniref:Class I SAM-dependent RNA methyltransferase n=1 Tax=Sphingomicrobium clamense TaxID=2851013 RepID=A0ABS6V6G3_9SPHN|nr:class I SAM-dependent RNA methyltransferase [Sphingomicrobium sp. B8]MBW0145154.1 class I SAM-dependent RNA methyltransferase [Sphingomicrobium sp. B8]
MTEVIVKVAARGEGVTASGQYFPMTAPGDVIENGQVAARGPNFQQPPCRHFPQCGGCQLQHLSDAAYAQYCVDRLVVALGKQDLEAEIRPPHLSPPRSRRRASLKALNVGGRIKLGFNEERSHRVVDLAECHILRPEQFALIGPLRDLLRHLVPPKRVAEVHMTLADQGVDLMLSGVRAEGLAAIEGMTDFATSQQLARLTIDEGYGAEPRWAPEPVTITLSGVPVGLPPGAFLQATKDGEEALALAVREAVGEGAILDLFAGLGTFSFALKDREVTAAEAGRDAVLSLQQAARRSGRSVTAQHRDLYRNPFQPNELAGFGSVVLDPPRSGAEAQVRALADSSVSSIAYVSCNPSTFARDARKLIDGGYRLDWVRPVGQFRWSTHVELASRFSR